MTIEDWKYDYKQEHVDKKISGLEEVKRIAQQRGHDIKFVIHSYKKDYIVNNILLFTTSGHTAWYSNESEEKFKLWTYSMRGEPIGQPSEIVQLTGVMNPDGKILTYPKNIAKL
ncbi:hypothetical protein [Priestia megaterium]